MTTIIACKKGKKVCIGADSLITWADIKKYQEQTGYSKLIPYKKGVFAFTGSAAFYQPFLLFLNKNKPNLHINTAQALFVFFNKFHNFLERDCGLQSAKESDFREITTFLYANSTSIWQIDSQRSIIEAKRFTAIGSGREFAMGVAESWYDENLDAYKIVQKSLNASCYLDLHSALPIEIISL